MTRTVQLEEAQATLKQLVDGLGPNDEVVIVEGRLPVARLTRTLNSPGEQRVPGNCKGIITLEVEDDEHLEHFRDYMP